MIKEGSVLINSRSLRGMIFLQSFLDPRYRWISLSLNVLQISGISVLVCLAACFSQDVSSSTFAWRYLLSLILLTWPNQLLVQNIDPRKKTWHVIEPQRLFPSQCQVVFIFVVFFFATSAKIDVISRITDVICACMFFPRFKWIVTHNPFKFGRFLVM